MENERNFNWLNTFVQVILFLILIVVLILIFPTKKFFDNGNNSNDNTATSTLLFNQNLTMMKDAGREYFTVSRMPKSNGDSKTLTLKEMIEKSMLVDLIDANGKSCNGDASYIKVTKNGKEYEMEVVLTCSGETKKIITVIGCYDYCDGKICERDDATKTCENVKTTLYEYKKTVNGKSYWSNWSNWSTTKVTTTKTREVETKLVNKTTGTVISYNNPSVKYNYYCDNGYKLSSDKKTCVKNVTNTITTGVITNTTKTCPEGYTLSGDSCVKTTYSYVDKTITKTCPTGYTLSGDSCVKTTYSYVDKTTTKTCPTGWTLSGNSCVKTTYSYENRITNYTCADSSYTLSGNTCSKTLSTKATPHIKTSFECVDGVCQTVTRVDYYYCQDKSYTLNGKMCYKTDRVNATISGYTCPTGYVDNGTNCSKANTETTSATVTKACPSGYNDNGKNCSKANTETISATVTKTCPSGYNDNGKNCSKANTETANVIVKTTKTCPTGYNLANDGSYCYKNVPGTDTRNSNYTKSYYCEEGTLTSDNLCRVEWSSTKDVIYYRYRTWTVTEDKTYTKWSSISNNVSLINAGWTKTGRTKEETTRVCK